MTLGADARRRPDRARRPRRAVTRTALREIFRALAADRGTTAPEGRTAAAGELGVSQGYETGAKRARATGAALALTLGCALAHLAAAQGRGATTAPAAARGGNATHDAARIRSRELRHRNRSARGLLAASGPGRPRPRRHADRARRPQRVVQFAVVAQRSRARSAGGPARWALRGRAAHGRAQRYGRDARRRAHRARTERRLARTRGTASHEPRSRGQLRRRRRGVARSRHRI